MHGLQSIQSLHQSEQEDDQGKIGTEEVLPILPQKHSSQRNKVIKIHA
jgi:hypothetical protein